MTLPLLSRTALSRYRKLLQRKFRREMQLFLVEGIRGCRQLIESAPDSIEMLLVSDPHSLPEWIPAGTRLAFLPHDELLSLCETETPQGMVAVVREPEPAGPEHTRGPVLVADRLQDPGNLGTLIRSLQWFGGNTFLCGTGTTDPFQAKVVRATAGAVVSTRFLEGTLPGLLQPWLDAGYQPFVLDIDPAARPLNGLQMPQKSLFIVGNEGNGISEAVRTAGFSSCYIAGPAGVESLNAAVTGAIALYHWFTCQSLTLQSER